MVDPMAELIKNHGRLGLVALVLPLTDLIKLSLGDENSLASPDPILSRQSRDVN